MKLVLAQVTESLVVRAGLGLPWAATTTATPTTTDIRCGAGLLAAPAAALTIVCRFVVSGNTLIP